MDIDYLRLIINERVDNIGRTADMCWIGFGEKIITKDYKGREREISTWALHLQCPWRITNTKDSQLVLSSNDIYLPNHSNKDNNDFYWDVAGSNHFDESVSLWKEKEMGMHVLSAKMNDFGDLSIALTNDLLIESFSVSTVGEEEWRLFKVGSQQEHMVFKEQKVIFE